MLTKLAIIGLVIAAGGGLYFIWTAGTISGAEASQLVSAGARLVDVRTPAEFADGHIAGAINIPVDRLPDHLDELGEKAEPIVVYCRSGARSARAKRFLEGEGFTKVSDLGGMHRWP